MTKTQSTARTSHWKRSLLALLLLAALVMSGCTAQAEKTTASATYFNTAVMFTLYDAPSGLVDELMKECERYEKLLSRTIEGSDVSRINGANGETVTVDPETWEILRRAKEISAMTGGAFSVTIAAETTQWDFTGGTKRMPTDEERLAAIELVDDNQLVLGENNTVTLPKGMMIDLGGIAKGYIADRLAEMVRGKVSGAILNFGGNVYLIGHKPDGTPFRTGVANPKNSATHLVVITLTDQSVVTSGTYERYFTRDGVTYHHILDPETGLPAETNLAGATIILESSMDADAIATACIVFGLEQSLSFLNEHDIDGVLIDGDNNVYVTKNLADRYPVALAAPAE